jgi:CheY-like chemotaxis protein
MGHGVVEAGDGRDAFARLRGESFDVILTDLVMPEKEGLESIPEFRKRYPSIKVIAMSGGIRGFHARALLRTAEVLGAARVLTKPFSDEEMAEAITSVLTE